MDVLRTAATMKTRSSKVPVPKQKSAPRKSGAVQRRLLRLTSIATEVFQEFGFEATTLELIAKRADISRQTIYNHFPTKEALFARIVDGVMNQVIETVDFVDDPDATAESQLTQYCEAIATEMITPERIGSTRLLMDVSRRHLLREFKTSKNMSIEGNLIVHLNEMMRRGKLDIPDPLQAVYILFGISMLPAHRMLLGIDKKGALDPGLRAAIREGVRMFCAYYAPKSTSTKPATRRR